MSVVLENILGDYWCAKFGDTKLVIDVKKNLYNASELCSDNNKRYDSWYNEHTSLIESYRMWDCGQTGGMNTPFPIVYRIDTIGGTYVPEQIILSVSMYISPSCYLMCYQIVNEVRKKIINELNVGRVMNAESVD